MSQRLGRCALPVLMCLLVLVSARAQVSEIAGTLPEDYLPELKGILANALKQSPQTIMKEIELARVTARVYGANAPRLPNASGYLNFASNETATTSNASSRTRDNGVFYNFGVSQAIFHWGALKNEADKARIGVLMAQKSYDEAYRLLAVALRRSYLELIVKKAQLTQMRYVRDLTKADVKLAEEKLASGTVSEGEVAGKKLNLEDYSLQTARVEVELSGLRRAFGRLAGVPEPVETAIPDALVGPKFSAANTAALLDKLVRDGAKSTFQAQVGQLKVQEADLNYRIARVRLLPKFKAGLNFSLENTTNASANSVTQQGVSRQTFSVGADWAIFDGLATRGAKLEAMANKRASERELQLATEAVIDAAQGLVQQLELDARAMDMADIRRTLAAGLVQNYKEELGRGNIAQNAVDSATASLKAADAANYAARAAYLSRWTEFVSLVAIDPVLNNLPARHDSAKR